MNKLFKTMVSVVTASTMALTAMSSFAITASAEEKGTVVPSYEEVIAAVESANDYYQSTVKYNQQEYGIPNSFWHKAAYETGNMEAYYTTGIEAYRNYAEAWASSCNWKGHTSSAPKNEWTYGYSQDQNSKAVLFGDFQICFQTYIDLYNIEQAESKNTITDANKVARALEVMGYEADISNDDLWWWADSLFMVMPVMTKLYKLTGDQKYLDKLYVQFKYAKELMYDGPGGIPSDASGYTTSAKLSNGASYMNPDEYTYLFYRDAGYVYPLKPNPGHENEKNFWARGDGWVFAGLAKVLQDMPDNYEHYDEFYNTYVEMAPAIKNCMVTDNNGYGFWTQSMLQNYPTSNENPYGYETSGTAFFTYGFAWGINSGILDKDEYYETTIRAWNYLQNVALQSNGLVGYVQYIGSNATKAMTKSDTQNFGVGAFLLAGCEVSRLVGGVQGDMYPYLQKKMVGNLALRVNTPHYYINGKIGHLFETDHSTEVYLKTDDNGNMTSMIPAAPVIEKFGGTVVWDDASHTVTATLGNRTVIFTVGSNQIIVNGTAMTAPTATEITNDRTFVPLRALCESLGKQVYWNEGDSVENGLIVIGDKAKPFYSCDANLVEMLRTSLAKPETYPTRPAQPEKSNLVTSRPASTSSTATGTKVNVSAANVTFSQQPEANNPGSNAFDSNSSTVWASQNQAYCIIDLGSAMDISCVGVQFKVYDDDRTIPYSIAVSEDNSTWSTIYSGSSVAKNSSYAYSTVGKNARYVKCQFDGNSVSGWNSVAGIEVYSGQVSDTAAVITTTTTTTASSTSSTATGTKVSVNAANVTFSQQPEANNPGKNAFDGNSSTVWASQNQANCIIDLGSSMAISSVGVQFKVYEDDRTIPYSIAVSDDKSTWTTVYSGSSVAKNASFAYATVGKTARYVKCQFEGNSVSGWNSVSGIEVYSGQVSSTASTATTTTTTVSSTTSANATGTKVSINVANVTFSQQPEANNPGKNAFDGNSSTVWSSQNQAYCIIDLGSSTSISSVGVQFKVYDDDRTIPYSIAVSDDKSTWTTVYSGSSVAKNASFAYATVGKKARYVRCQFDGNSVSGWNSVSGIEVYSGQVAATANAVAATTASTVTAGKTYIVTVGNLCLESTGSSLTAVAKVSRNSVKWQLVDAGGSAYALKNVSNAESMDVSEESQNAGAQVITWEYKASDNQLFYLEKSGNGYLIKMKHSGLYLTYNSNGTFTQEYRDTAKSQVFTFEQQ
jgi:rhamnogalacturonyl hydrolase YesR